MDGDFQFENTILGPHEINRVNEADSYSFLFSASADYQVQEVENLMEIYKFDNETIAKAYERLGCAAFFRGHMTQTETYWRKALTFRKEQCCQKLPETIGKIEEFKDEAELEELFKSRQKLQLILQAGLVSSRVLYPIHDSTHTMFKIFVFFTFFEGTPSDFWNYVFGTGSSDENRFVDAVIYMSAIQYFLRYECKFRTGLGSMGVPSWNSLVANLEFWIDAFKSEIHLQRDIMDLMIDLLITISENEQFKTDSDKIRELVSRHEKEASFLVFVMNRFKRRDREIVQVAKALIECGADPNTSGSEKLWEMALRDYAGTDLLLYLREIGIHICLNRRVQDYFDSKKECVQIIRTPSLQCLAARTIAKENIQCQRLPRLLQKFVHLH